MKNIILTLKTLTGHTSDAAFAEFVGVTENTITRAKAGHNTKLNTVLPMLEHLIVMSHEAELKIFLKKFKSP